MVNVQSAAGTEDGDDDGKSDSSFRRRDFEGLVNVVNTPATPVDAQGRYIISSFAPDDREEIQTSSSLWRVKVGLSYRF